MVNKKETYLKRFIFACIDEKHLVCIAENERASHTTAQLIEILH
jgi:hypothetical protein